MKGIETRGLIVKCTDYGESDRIVTVITERMGKVRGIAKGARRSIKRFGGCLETFSLVSLLIREGKSLSYIGEGRVLKDFREIKKDIEKISYGSYMLEISEAVALDDDAQFENLAPNNEPVSDTVFSLLLDAIKSLANSREPEAEARGFEVRLLAMAGYLPSFLNCLSCRGSVLEGEKNKVRVSFDSALFSSARGGVLCTKCAASETKPLDFISAGTLKTLNSAVKGKALFTKNSLEESGRLMRGFISHHLDKRLKTLEFIDKMKGL